MTDDLKYPSGHEQHQGPSPAKEEQRQRQNDHRDANRMREPVERMTMFGFVVIDKRIGHDQEFSQTSMKMSMVPPQTMPSSLASSAVRAERCRPRSPLCIASRASDH